MDDGVHENPTYFRGGVCNKMLTISEDDVYANRVACFHYGGVFTM